MLGLASLARCSGKIIETPGGGFGHGPSSVKQRKLLDAEEDELEEEC